MIKIILFFSLATFMEANSFDCEKQSNDMMVKFQDGLKSQYENKNKDAKIYFEKSIKSGFLALEFCDKDNNELSDFLYGYISASEAKIDHIEYW